MILVACIDICTRVLMYFMPVRTLTDLCFSCPAFALHLMFNVHSKKGTGNIV